MKRYVIIGNGVAAVGCVEGIRSVDPEGAITIVSSERWHAYCRPLISYYLEGRAAIPRMSYRGEDFYRVNHCELLLGVRAVKLDASARTVALDDGSVLSYDTVCLATGSSPFVPPMTGLETVANKHSFMTLDDAIKLEQSVDTSSRVLIVGAGLIGLKCAEGLCERVASITVCDLAPRVLSSVLDQECAERMQALLESHGMRFFLGDSVAQFRGNCAIMHGGAQVEFDALVLAVGVRANIGLAREIGAKCGRAIQVDAHMSTSVSGVYAAGDCTESYDASSGTIKVMALMPNAYQQGFCAGLNMSGHSHEYLEGIPMNAIGFWGLHALTAGTRYSEEEGGQTYVERDAEHIKKLYIKDGKLTGMILLGEVERAGIYCQMIRSGRALDSVDFDAMQIRPSLSALSSSERGHILGELV